MAPRWRVVVHAMIVAALVPPPSGLESAMQQLRVRSALVVASQSVDESPVWSPSGDAIAVNIEGEWKKADLRSPKLVAGTWHGKEPIGVLEAPNTPSIPEAEVRTWEETASAGPRKVVAKDGAKAELLSEGLGTRFVITRKGADPETLWTTTMENCHSLALSPDGRQVAYICELNGVIVTNLTP